MSSTFQLTCHLLRGPPSPSHYSVTSVTSLTPSPYFNPLPGTHPQLGLLLCLFTGRLSCANVTSASEGPCLPRLAFPDHSRCSINHGHTSRLTHRYPSSSAPVSTADHGAGQAFPGEDLPQLPPGCPGGCSSLSLLLLLAEGPICNPLGKEVGK